jgi:glycerol-3-phosphate dehydrogenase subunit C
MLRYRAVEARKGAIPLADKQLAETDRNGKLAVLAAPLANWATDAEHKTTRALVEKVAGLHHDAALPKYSAESFESLARKSTPEVDKTAPAFGRKAVLYATCYTNYNDPSVGLSARAVLAKNGVRTEVVHPHCCGMPLLEQGLVADVAEAARRVAAALKVYIDLGYDVIALVPSCALMLKSEWPLILPDDSDVKLLARATYDLSEYVVDLAKKEGLAPGMESVEGGVALHIACHSRAQNMGRKAADMLRLVPGADVEVIERCSGHGGAWGYKTANFETALKVGAPVARQVETAKKTFVSSECPLAGLHIAQGVERLGNEAEAPHLLGHPIQLLERAYGLAGAKPPVEK